MRTAISDEGYRKGRERSAAEPAATVTGKHRSAVWHDAPAMVRPPGRADTLP